ALADDGVVFVAPALLIVHGVVLDVANNMRRLLAFDAIANHGSGENGIFTHVLKCATAAKLADEIHAAAERHVVALGTQFAADHIAVFTSSVRVPARSGAQVRR